MGRQSDRWNDWKSLKIPTLLIRGEKSEDLPQEVFDKMLRENRNARGIVIKNAGHWVHFDSPQEFIEELRSFLLAKF